MLVSEAAELLLVLGEMSTELSNLCMELQSITSSSSVGLVEASPGFVLLLLAPWAVVHHHHVMQAHPHFGHMGAPQGQMGHVPLQSDLHDDGGAAGP